jgi:hypothetical protein
VSGINTPFETIEKYLLGTLKTWIVISIIFRVRISEGSERKDGLFSKKGKLHKKKEKKKFNFDVPNSHIQC